MKKSDSILLILLGFLLLSAITFSLIHNLVASLFIAFLLTILFRTLFIHFFRRKINKAIISVTDMENELSMMGTEQVNYFFSVIPTAFSPTKLDSGISFTYKNDLIFLAVNYKFTSTSLDDIAKFYRLAKSKKISTIWILGRVPSRNILVFADGLDIRFKFITGKQLHKYLLSQNALMPKRRKIKNPKKPNLKKIFSGMFTKKRAKYFLISGLSLSFFAFFGIMRVYYLIMASLCLVFALISFIKKT